MTVNGVGQVDRYSNFQLNTIREQEVRVAEPQKQEQTKQEEQVTSMPLSLNLKGIVAKHEANLSDVKLSMEQSANAAKDRELLGFKNNDEDMDRAIYDMQKDPALMQYSYFIGDSSNVILDNEDGMVIRK